jgi:hypothetical protein
MVTIIGLGGKIASGKTTIAYTLRRYLKSESTPTYIVPLASSLKGTTTFLLGLSAWFPQKDLEARRTLQKLGSVGRQTDSALWIKVVESTIDYLKALHPTATNLNIIVPDVRYVNEVTAFEEFADQTLIIYLESNAPVSLPDDVVQHPSEALPPSICDIVVRGDSIKDKARQTLKFLSDKGIPLHNNPPTLYVGHNITETDDTTLPLTLMEQLEGYGYKVVMPLDLCDWNEWHEKLRDDGLGRASNEVVMGILNVLSQCDGAVFVIKGGSIGIGCELLASAVLGLPTLTLVLSNHLLTHPFVNAFSTVVCYGLDSLHKIKDVVWVNLNV